jgi:hypothetical protein
MKPAWFLLLAVAAQAQNADQTGGVQGVVTDAVTHMPLKRAMVTVDPMGNSGNRNPGLQATSTDAGGAFTVGNLPAGQYRVVVQRQGYPQAGGGAMSRRIEIKAGVITGPVNLELMPGASVTGHVVDEDGDALPNCNIELTQASRPGQGFQFEGRSSNEDGEYRLFGISPGKYKISVHCGNIVFEPRPFSAGPDLESSQAYPTQYYPLTSDAKSAEVVQLTAGTEKSGIDFVMRPAAVTQVRGAFTATGADWRGSQLNLQLAPSEGNGTMMSASIDRAKGTFLIRPVFPGSYLLAAFSNGPEDGRIGALQRIEVGDRPVELALELRAAIELKGTVEIESKSSNSVNLAQTQIFLNPHDQVGYPPAHAQVAADGSFTLRGVLPAPFLLFVSAPSAFVKSAWLGSIDVTKGAVDLSNGGAGALRIVISTNTATIRGSAPAGESILAQRADEEIRFAPNRGTQADQSGQYKLEGLAPGKYRLMVMDQGGRMPDEGGQEITVQEGETAMLDLKAPSQ